jgi:hypothetical protein
MVERRNLLDCAVHSMEAIDRSMNCDRSQCTSALAHTHTIMHEYDRSHLMCDRVHSGNKVT